MREPLVFLPGVMADARAFGPQIADLSRERAVMSLSPVNGERVEELASAALDVLPRRAALVGHGLGANVAMEILRRAPERIARVALLSASPLAETPAQAAERDPRMIRARAGKLEEAMAEELPADHLAPGPYRGEILALCRDMALGLGVEVFLRQSRALQRRRDQQTTLRKIVVPALVLCGALDPVHPVKRHAFMAELIPGARLRVIDAAGRLPALEQPEAVADALRDWLAQPLLLR